MKRIVVSLVLLALVFGGLALPAQAQSEAPQGVFYGTWPYVLPPDHHLNPFAAGGPNDNLGVIFRSYVQLPPAIYKWATSEYMPLLAEDWGFADDGSYYWFRLRDDAMWSNGDPITSEDVVVTYALGRLVGWSQFNYITDVIAVDEHTVRFPFSGDPSLVAERLLLKENLIDRATYGELAQRALDLFATGATRDSEAWGALRTELTEFRPAELVASGPYTYGLEDVGDAFLTMRWQPNSIFSGTVRFGSIRIWAGETEVSTPLVLSGELGHSTNVYPASTIESFQALGIRLIDIPRAYGPALLFNHAIAPWNITAVRQAVALVINREQNAFLTNGIGAVGTVYMCGLLDDNVPQFLNQDVIDQLDRYEFDLDRAEALMIGAGFSRNADGKWADADGNVISAEYKFPAEFADFSGAAQDAVAQMNAFGFDITPRALPWQESAAAIRAGEFELSVWSWAGPQPFASRQFFGPIQRFNYVALTGGQRGMDFPMEFEWNGRMINLDDMITHASDGLDLEVQRQRAGEIALIINQLMPFIPLNIIRSIEPLNENLIAGFPADGDPWFINPTGSDHPIIYFLLTGVISPGPNAIGM
jgi:peptide/nickel transport system substrate-binding protein